MWPKLAFLLVLAWMLVVLNWANQSWTETVDLVTPPGVEAQAQEFECSAPFDARAADPKGGGESVHPPAREPCQVHGERRSLAIFDLAFGALLLAAGIYVTSRYSARREPALTGDAAG